MREWLPVTHSSMQTNPNDPRAKLMQKWSQSMPPYGMQGAALRAGAEEDDDEESH